MKNSRQLSALSLGLLNSIVDYFPIFPILILQLDQKTEKRFKQLFLDRNSAFRRQMGPHGFVIF
jgi:hypothetical protein